MDPNAQQVILNLKRQYDSLFSQVDAVLDGRAGLDAQQTADYFKALDTAHQNLLTALQNAVKNNVTAWDNIAVQVQQTQQAIDNASNNISSFSATINGIANLINNVTQAIAVLPTL